jgi:adenosylcobyric acid synthase
VSALSVQGTSSGAGKSLLTTALARLWARRGVRVAPFKASNMSNNARVCAGGEIGAAQWFQALAAGVEPEVRMNPVLVKPEADTRSQVVVLGCADLELSRTPWPERGARLAPVVDGALRSLLAEFELVLIEGAGSPAEINLLEHDLSNMRAARRAGAPVLLVADIDRGGAFAHLYGTWALVPEADRRRFGAFVLNRFRGDASLLPPGPERLRELTGVPVAGVLPWLEHGLPDEDGAAVPRARGGRPVVAVVRYPTASNLDEYKALERAADVRWVGRPEELAGADLVVLPGSKHVAGDATWLARTGLGGAVVAAARSGRRVLGICGGLQLLGERVEDAAGVDGDAAGLGLLPLRTVFAGDKLVRRSEAMLGELPAPWAALSGLRVAGYEIRHGRTEAVGPCRRTADGLAFAAGPVLGVYLHGLLEQPHVVRALLGSASDASLDAVFDALADAAEEHLDSALLDRLAGVA